MEKKTNLLIGFIKKLDLVAFWLSKISSFIAGMILVFVALMICAGVFNRLFIHATWLFVEEWSGLLLIPMSYLAFGFTLRYDKHLKMDLIVKNVPPKAQNALAIFAGVFSLVCLCFLIQFAWTWFDYTVTRDAVSSGPMQTPLWMFSLAILVGMITMTLDMALFTINRILDLIIKEAPLKFVGEINLEKK